MCSMGLEMKGKSRPVQELETSMSGNNEPAAAAMAVWEVSSGLPETLATARQNSAKNIWVGEVTGARLGSYSEMRTLLTKILREVLTKTKYAPKLKLSLMLTEPMYSIGLNRRRVVPRMFGTEIDWT